MDWGDVILALAAAIVGGVVGWFGHDQVHTQRTRVKGNENTAITGGQDAAGRDITKPGRDSVGTQYNVIHPTPADEPYVTTDLRQRPDSSTVDVYLRNVSSTHPAVNVQWALSPPDAQIEKLLRIAPPTASFTLAPAGERKLGFFTKAWGVNVYGLLTIEWDGQDGTRGRHEQDLVP